MPSAEPFPAENSLLASLPGKDRQQFLSGCEQVGLTFGNVLCEPGAAIRYVYFPTDSFISLIVSIEGQRTLEVELVGSEGMCGISLVLGVESTSLRAVVQGSGAAWRMEVERFLSELKRSVALQQALHRYIHVSLGQLAQTAACIRYHVVEERLARWLLMTRDRAHSDEFHITHEFLAHMLGVRRVGVTKAAGELQRKELISYSRGNVRIRDTGGLEAAACGCYRADKEMYESVMKRT